MNLFRRSTRVLAASLALALLLAACGGDDDTVDTGEDGESGESAAGDHADNEDGGDASSSGIDCDEIDAEQIAQITGAEVGEIEPYGGDNFSHENNDQEWTGSRHGCEVALSYDEFGSQELEVDIRTMEPGYFDSLKAQSESSDEYEPVDGLGDDAFRDEFIADVRIAVQVGDQVLIVELSEDVEPDTSTLIALAEYFLQPRV